MSVLLQVVGGRLEAEILQDQVWRGRDGRGLQAEGGPVVRRRSLLGAALLLPGNTEVGLWMDIRTLINCNDSLSVCWETTNERRRVSQTLLNTRATGSQCKVKKSSVWSVWANRPAHTLFAVWLYTKSFHCCKILIFILKWNNQLWALFSRAGPPRGWAAGDLSGLIVSRVICTLCVDARQSKARLRGAVLDEFISRPSADEDVSAPRRHTFTVPELWSRTPRQMIREGWAGSSRHKRPDAHFVSQPLIFVGVYPDGDIFLFDSI